MTPGSMCKAADVMHMLWFLCLMLMFAMPKAGATAACYRPKLPLKLLISPTC